MFSKVNVADVSLTILSAAASLASLIGLRLALKANRDSQNQAAQLKDMVAGQNFAQEKLGIVSESLTTVAKSLTTRYIGVHPNYMNHIQGLVSKAEHSLFVMSSVPGFGIFSSLHEWDKLKALIEEAQYRPNFKLSLLTGSEESRKKRLRLQFKEAYENWDKWILTDDNAHKVKLFAERNHEKCPESNQIEWFERMLLQANEKIRHEVYFSTIARITDDFLPVIAWIADDRRAVFALSNTMGNFPGFYTEDHYIVQSLMGMAERIVKDLSVPDTFTK